ncbi:MAG: nucleoside deaminase [Opitutales bacterium]
MPPADPIPPGIDWPALIARFLEVIECDIAPLTREGVAEGNKVFGAAILRKSDLSVVTAGTNQEQESALWHGEMQTIRQFHAIPFAQRPKPTDCYFLTTHECCPMCLSGVTWAGFDNFFYFFEQEDLGEAFSIPHDARILKEVFKLPPSGYAHANEYWRCWALRKCVAELGSPADLTAAVDRLDKLYAELSASYIAQRDNLHVPLN